MYLHKWYMTKCVDNRNGKFIVQNVLGSEKKVNYWSQKLTGLVTNLQHTLLKNKSESRLLCEHIH